MRLYVIPRGIRGLECASGGGVGGVGVHLWVGVVCAFVGRVGLGCTCGWGWGWGFVLMLECSILGTCFDDDSGDENEGEVEKTGKPRQVFLVCHLLCLSHGIPVTQVALETEWKQACG